MEEEQKPLQAVRCPGSLLAALLLDAGKAATSAAGGGGGGGGSEGLLLGRGVRRREEVRGDDAHEAGERTVVETDLAAFLRTTAPQGGGGYGCGCCSFYGQDGRVRPPRLKRHLEAAGLPANSGHGNHRVVGWYVTRPAGGSSNSSSSNSPPRPTLRDLAVLQSLGQYLKEEHAQQGQGAHNVVVLPPPVLLVVSLGLRPREPTQAWSYGCYYLSGAEGAMAAVEGDSSPPPLVPRPLLLEIRNVAHDSAAEYRAYRGGYTLPLLEGGNGRGSGGGGAAAVGAPMPPVLASLASKVPSPLVEEMEVHFDGLIGRLHGLVDAIAAEEARVLALQHEHQQLRRRLAEQGREGEGQPMQQPS